MKAKFRLGTLVATPGALDALPREISKSSSVDDSNPFISRGKPSREALLDLVQRHASGDWGDLDAHDKEANDVAVREGFRLLSAYELEGTRFWIITEADRSTTTILLPDEY